MIKSEEGKERIRKKEKNFKVEIRWTNGRKEMINITKLNQTIIVRQK